MINQELRIQAVGCQIDDTHALDALIAAIPERDDLRAGLVSDWRGTAQRYDEEQQRAFFIVSDGRHVNCHTISGFAFDQGEQIAALCKGAAAPTIDAFKTSIEGELKATVRWWS